MKKITYLVMLGVLMIFATCSLHASQASRMPGWFGEVGLEGYYYHYQENDTDDNFLSNHKGPMYGFFVTFGYQPECIDLRFALDGLVSWSRNIHYDSRDAGNYDGSKHGMPELRLLALYPWHFASEWTLEGYTGLGHRHLLYDDSDITSSTGHYGVFRSSIYNYIPIGIRVIKEYADMQIVSHFEYDWLRVGDQFTSSNSHLSACNNQRNGFGFRTGLDLYIPFSSVAVDYRIGGFIRFWNMGDSDVDYFLYRPSYSVPRNTTVEIGLRVGVSY